MYKIFFCDLAKATNNKEIGKRPVVSVGLVDGKYKVYKITSRYKVGSKYVRMNPYIIRGYCDVSQYYLVDKKHFISFQRDCTSSEIDAINEYKRR